MKPALESFIPNIHLDTITIEICLTETWKAFSMAHAEILIERIFSSHCSNKCQWYRIYTEPTTVAFTVHNSYLMLLIVNSVKVIESMKQWGVVSLKIGTICVLQTRKGSEEKGNRILDQLFKLNDHTEFNAVMPKLSLPAERKRRKYTFGAFVHHLVNAENDIDDIVIDNNNNFNVNYDYESSLLMIACCNSNTELVELLLDKGADPNAVNATGWTALMYASIVGNIKVVNMLLTHSAVPGVSNFHNETALTYASLAGNVEVVKKLLNKPEKKQGNKVLLVALLYASKKNHLEIVKELLQFQNYDIEEITTTTTTDERNSFSQTLLYIASKKGYFGIVEELLKTNVDPNIERYQKSGDAFIHVVLPGFDGFDTPLFAAASRGHLLVVQKLLSAHADPNGGTSTIKPIIPASYEGYTQIVELLLKAGANPNEVEHYMTTTTPLHLACEKGHYPVVDLLLQNGADPNFHPENMSNNPLQLAVKNCFLKIAGRLLSAKANPDGPADTYFNDIPLFTAAANGNLQMMKLLLKAGADPNCELNSQKNHRILPITTAIQKSNLEAVVLLLHRNADPNCKNYMGGTPLQCAAGFGCIDILKILLNEGVDINEMDNDGHTALHNAAEGDHSDIVDILLNNNADPNIQRRFDAATPLHISIMARNRNISKSLLENKADPDILLDSKYLNKFYFQAKQYSAIPQEQG